MYQIINRNKNRRKRHARQIKKLKGTAKRPRLCVYKSLKQIYVQVVDDCTGVTLCGASTLSAQFKSLSQKPGVNRENAKILGQLVAGLCKEKQIESVVFDRSGYPYHGSVAILAETARESGLVL